MKLWFLILLPLILTGCLEDKEALISECILKYEKNAINGDNIMLCMDAKGYDFGRRWKDDKLTETNNECWLVDEKNFPYEPLYTSAKCYTKRTMIDIWKQYK
jgi:hypothetical protein